MAQTSHKIHIHVYVSIFISIFTFLFNLCIQFKLIIIHLMFKGSEAPASAKNLSIIQDKVWEK